MGGELSPTKRLQLKYWTELWGILDRLHPDIRGTKARPQHWNNFSIGRSDIGLAASMDTQKKFVRVCVRCKGANARANFELLRRQKKEIEAEVGSSLNWDPLPNRKQSRVCILKSDVDPNDESDWPDQHRWLADQLNAFDKAFRQRIRNLAPNEVNADDDPDTDGEDVVE
ncbi:MAG: DUF4268 domain-containing protein [Pirellulales bacterium]